MVHVTKSTILEGKLIVISALGNLKQRNIKLDWLNSLCWEPVTLFCPPCQHWWVFLLCDHLLQDLLPKVKISRLIRQVNCVVCLCRTYFSHVMRVPL